MRTFGLIGYPLTHSFSQKYFKEKFKREKISDCEFKNFPLENIDEFPALLISNPSLSGLSITIPYKQTATQYLNEVDVVAKNVGAVNCVKILKMENGKPKAVGYNTDVYGFEESIKPVLNPRHSRVLILGTGGAAKAVAYVLLKLKINFLFLSSSQQPAAFPTVQLRLKLFRSTLSLSTPLLSVCFPIQVCVRKFLTNILRKNICSMI